MNRSDLYELVEVCLRQIEAGRSLEQVLAEQGEEAAELRPILEAALMARAMSESITIPAAAQNRSRAQFLAAAAEARSPARRQVFGWLPPLRLAAAPMIVIIALIFTVMLGSGLASAQSLPGDTLYPVKIAVERARLSLASGTSQRLELEESFDHERLEESQELLQRNREQTVEFAGFLVRDPDQTWEVGSLHLDFAPEMEALAASYEGLYVEIEGRSTGKRIAVQSLNVRLFDLLGTVEKINLDGWTISGVNVHLTTETTVEALPKVGSRVRVTAMRQQNGDLVALLIGLDSSPAGRVTYAPPTRTATPTHEVEDDYQIEATDDHDGSSDDHPEIKETRQPEHQDDSNSSDDSSQDSNNQDDHQDEQQSQDDSSHSSDENHSGNDENDSEDH